MHSLFLRSVVAIATLAVTGCGRFSGDPSRRVAADVGDRHVTVAEIQAYLDANLLQDPAIDAPSTGDLDRVKSRLVDDFLDEEIQLLEAERRAVTVSDAELADYLDAAAPADVSRRALARRELMIQKLRESVVRAGAAVSESEVDAWLAAEPAGQAPAVHGTVRTLRFASYPEAERVRREIKAGRLSFLEAGVTYADASNGGAREVDLAALPEPLAGAVAKMKPGEVSAPVPYESSVLLFLLESIDDPQVAEARRRDRARQAMVLERSQAATDRFLEALRKSTPVSIHAKALPFRYVPESDARQPAGGGSE